MTKGQRILAFDKIGWIMAGRPENMIEEFRKPATFLYINPHYPEQGVIRFDGHGHRSTSHGHLIKDLKPLS